MRHLPSVMLSAIVLLLAARAGADANKCQQALDKAGTKFEATVGKAIAKCVKAAQAEVDSGLPVSLDAAASCNAAIEKLNKARGKALGKCLGLGESGSKCSLEDLYLAGHLVSGAFESASTGSLNGAGVADIGLTTGSIDFTCQWLIDNAMQHAIQGLVDRVPSARSRIDEAAAADIALTYPELQQFAARQPACATHICRLDSANSGIYIDSSTMGSVPFAVSGNLAIDFCPAVQSGDTRSVQGGTMLLMGGAAKGLPPINMLNLITICTRILRVEGECNCGQGSPANRDLAICRDADDTTGLNCAADANTRVLESSGGTDNGPLFIDFNSPSLSTGGCHGALTMEWAIHNGPPVSASCTQSGPAMQKLPTTTIQFTTGNAIGSLLDTQSGTMTATGGVIGTSNSPGAGITCNGLDAGTLAGLQLVGAQPVLDFPLFSDAVIGLGLTCQ